jgi:hypothetical protein
MNSNIFYSIFKFFKYVFYSILTLRRDVKALLLLSRTKRKIAYMDKYQPSVPQIFNQWVKKWPDKEFVVFNETIWTFQEVILRIMLI